MDSVDINKPFKIQSFIPTILINHPLWDCKFVFSCKWVCCDRLDLRFRVVFNSYSSLLPVYSTFVFFASYPCGHFYTRKNFCTPYVFFLGFGIKTHSPSFLIYLLTFPLMFLILPSGKPIASMFSLCVPHFKFV